MKKKITICMGSSCFTRGNKDNLKIIQDYLKDYDSAEIVLTGSLCKEQCSNGPVIYLDDTMYSCLDTAQLTDLLDSFVKEPSTMESK